MLRLIFCALATVLFIDLSVYAQEPKQAVQEVLDQVLNQPTEEAEKTIEKKIDAESLAKKVIGPVWSELDKEDQEIIKAKYPKLIVKHYSGILRTHLKPDIQLVTQRVKSDTATVTLRVRGVDNRYSFIQCRLILTKTGWKLYDLVYAGLNISSIERTQIYQLVKKLGKEALADVLATSTSSHGSQRKFDYYLIWSTLKSIMKIAR